MAQVSDQVVAGNSRTTRGGVSTLIAKVDQFPSGPSHCWLGEAIIGALIEGTFCLLYSLTSPASSTGAHIMGIARLVSAQNLKNAIGTD